MNPLFEFMPFLGGCAYGFAARRSGWRGLWPNVLIGALVALLAGELTQGGAVAFVALLFDSATALAGCVAVRFIRRLATSRGGQL